MEHMKRKLLSNTPFKVGSSTQSKKHPVDNRSSLCLLLSDSRVNTCMRLASTKITRRRLTYRRSSARHYRLNDAVLSVIYRFYT